MTRSVHALEVEQPTLAFLLASIALVVFPHLFALPWPLMLFFFMVLAWRFAAVWNEHLLPNPKFLSLLTFLGAGLVLIRFHGFLGRDAGTSLFVVCLGLKLMELKRLRDVYLVVYLAFFVAITQFLFQQTILMAVYTFAVVCLLVAALIRLNGGGALDCRASLKLAGTLLLQALPVMLLLFILFPRISGPLWHLPDESAEARTGLSDTLEPGRVSRLSLSAETAFRVHFDGPMPPPDALYWRGPVFWKTDGRRWMAAEPPLPASARPPPQNIGPTYRYTVMLEPHQRTWVFGLDLPAPQQDGDILQTAEYQLLAREKIRERKAFRLTSYGRYRTGALSAREEQLGLQLPRQPSARVMALIDEWREASTDAADLAERALAFFREQHFVYTLNPPAIQRDPVESFLFETRAGYCEHFATAFVYLMRAAGIPARIVTGYQGGTLNPLGRFLDIKQADAHAWAEIGLAQRGWVRIDPTSAVAPERVERGIDLERQIASGQISYNPVVRAPPPLLANLWRQVRFAWSGVDFAWQRWVLSYSPKTQMRLLARFGIESRHAMIAWLAAGLALLIALLAFALLRKRRQKVDKVLRIYHRFTRKLARKGLSKRPAEGPGDFSSRAAAACPDLARPIKEITAIYLRLRYGRGARADDLKRLERLVRALPV